MDWKQPSNDRDSRLQIADLVDNPGFTLPYAPDIPVVAKESLPRLSQGPFIMGGDLCEVQSGREAIILISPSGESIIMQNDGRVTFHVPNGWKLMVGSSPLQTAEHITGLYREAEATH